MYKKLFLENFKNKHNKKWNFTKELLIFNDQKLFLLTKSCLSFVKECFELHLVLNEPSDKNSNTNFLHPFSTPLVSMGSYIFKLFKILYLNKENIYCINNEFGKSCEKVSKSEYEWTCVMNFLYPERQFQSEFNNKNGQKNGK